MLPAGRNMPMRSSAPPAIALGSGKRLFGDAEQSQ
jgi:hypothetical protein